MNRVALDLGIVKIYWYSIMIFLGVLSGFLLTSMEAKRKKIDKNIFDNMVFYAVLCGFIGARLYYVLFNLEYYLASPIEIIKVWNGGMAIHGGIIGAMIAIYFYTKKNRLSFLELLDISVPGLLIGQIIGRWGNFFNGEAHGGVISRMFLEKLHLPKFIIDGMYINGAYYHPTFFYESILNLVCLLLLLLIRRKKNIHLGLILGIYCIWYGIIRFFIEGLRTDSLMLGSLKMAQIISIVLIIFGIILIITSFKKPFYNREEK